MRREWLIWLFLVVASIAIVVRSARADDPIAYCNEEGQCVIARDMLQKIMRSVVFWHDKAVKCEAI